MSSATSYCYLPLPAYTDSEPGRAFWGADDEEISEGAFHVSIVLRKTDWTPATASSPTITRFNTRPIDKKEKEKPQTPGPCTSERGRAVMQLLQNSTMTLTKLSREPIYPEYIPLEDDHEFPAEEQPLPPIDSPTTERLMEMNDDGDSSRDDARDEDEDEEDEEDEEEEEHLAPAALLPSHTSDEPIPPPD
ncbi:hypothetical protein Tco_1532523 [Tanacetum coccineum]